MILKPLSRVLTPFTSGCILIYEKIIGGCGLPKVSGMTVSPDLRKSHWFWAAGGWGGLSMFGCLFVGAEGAEVGFCTSPVDWLEVGLVSATGEAGWLLLPA